MDGFTFNKIAGAILATLLFGFFVIEVSHWLYPNPREAEHAEQMGYPVPGQEDGHGGGDTAVAAPVIDLPALLASADVAAGEAQFRACGSCHNDAPGAGNKVGPNLWGVVGRVIGSAEGFNYSGAMRSHEGTWSFENLFTFLESPSDFVPGTSMGYGGLRRATDRANLIAYLNQQSDSPLTLPAVAEEASSAETGAAAVVASASDGESVADEAMVENAGTAPEAPAETMNAAEETGSAATEAVLEEPEVTEDETIAAEEPATVATAAHESPANASDGGTIFNTSCTACHGADGRGAFPGVPDFTRPDGRLTKSDDELFNNVAQGFASPGSVMAMPARGGNPNLTDEDIRNVIAYIRETFGSQ